MRHFWGYTSVEYREPSHYPQFIPQQNPFKQWCLSCGLQHYRQIEGSSREYILSMHKGWWDRKGTCTVNFKPPNQPIISQMYYKEHVVTKSRELQKGTQFLTQCQRVLHISTSLGSSFQNYLEASRTTHSGIRGRDLPGHVMHAAVAVRCVYLRACRC